MKSIFTDKNIEPAIDQLHQGLGESFHIWKHLQEFTVSQYPEAVGQWHFSGEKFGWSYRIKDKKRVLLYLLPRDQFFKAAFVFGQKAFDQIMESRISETIKTELKEAKKYAEGRGIRIEVKDTSNLQDLEQLIRIKIS